jgi:AraC family transcriptional regulator
VASVPEGVKKHHLSTMENARDYLIRHLTEDVGLAQLADHCHVSIFHFSRLFKAVLNTTPHHYLAELRLNHAQLLLQSTQVSVTQVAYQSGFNSLEHFVTAYRQRFGHTPRDERKLELRS